MEERIRPSKSGLLSIELLICVGVFAFCAAVCTGILVRAELISRDSAELNRTVYAARNVAECYLAAGGSLERTAELCGGGLENGTLVSEADGVILRLSPEPAKDVVAGRLTAVRGSDTLLTWRIAVPEVQP